MFDIKTFIRLELVALGEFLKHRSIVLRIVARNMTDLGFME